MVGVGPNEGSWHLRILEKMGLIKSEHVGRYLVYHANNSDHIGSRDRPASLITNSNATKILEHLLRNPGVKITHVTHALMMNRNTASYHIKRMQTSGLIERVERNGLRLTPTGDDLGEGLAPVIANPMASRIDVALPKVDFSASDGNGELQRSTRSQVSS
jgi:DNA-binding transcriptional ArsR family regulator